MANIQRKPTKLKLHILAEDEVVKVVKDYVDIIVTQSQTVAANEGADEVQSIHVKKAHLILSEYNFNNNRKKEWAKFIGSVMLGAFLQGFITE